MSRWLPHRRRSPLEAGEGAEVEPTPAPAPGPSAFPQGIKNLYNPDRAVVDIVFVHGLTGGRERTWTGASASQPWPECLLPSKVPVARILTYGYDAYVLRTGVASTNRVSDHSRDLVHCLIDYRLLTKSAGRPIIFVAHSLGGIICKDALLFSRHPPEQHLRDLYISTRAIAFMGTPHSGSTFADWGKLPASAFGYVKSTNQSLLSVLRSNSEFLERVQNDFTILLRHPDEGRHPLQIACFFEALPMPVVGKIVSQSSATIDGYSKISVHGNHSQMVKFASEEDPGFISVASVLFRWTTELSNSTNTIDPRVAAQTRNERLQVSSDVLQSLSYPEMEVRRSEIDRPSQGTCYWILENALYQRWSRNLNAPKHRAGQDVLLWIKGKPGSGKSTLLKELYQHHLNPSLPDSFYKFENPSLRRSGNAQPKICLAFFFNARGAPIERSPEGFYKTLLHQLLSRSETAMQAFIDVYHRKKEAFGDQTIVWAVSELAEVFFDLIVLPQIVARRTGGTDSQPMLAAEKLQVEIFVDALDECKDDDVRTIVRSFEKCADISKTNNVDLRICWSSRHYPHISVRESSEIRMEDENAADIEEYLRQELSRHRIHSITEIRKLLVSKASGVFLWVVLAVRRLLKAIDQGISESSLILFLQELPSELGTLYEQAVQSIDPDHWLNTVAILKWIIAERQPLEGATLALIEAFGPAFRTTKPRRVPSSAEGVDRVRRYVTDVSGGLLEATFTSARGNPVIVQVIHESVRDFFLIGKGCKILGFSSQDELIDASHDCIMSICLNFMLSVAERNNLLHGYALPFQGYLGFLLRSFDLGLDTQAKPLYEYSLLHFFTHAIQKHQLGDAPATKSDNEYRAHQGLKLWLLSYIYRVPFRTQGDRAWFQDLLRLVIANHHVFGLSPHDLLDLLRCIDDLNMSFAILNRIGVRREVNKQLILSRNCYRLFVWMYPRPESDTDRIKFNNLVVVPPAADLHSGMVQSAYRRYLEAAGLPRLHMKFTFEPMFTTAWQISNDCRAITQEILAPAQLDEQNFARWKNNSCAYDNQDAGVMFLVVRDSQSFHEASTNGSRTSLVSHTTTEASHSAEARFKITYTDYDRLRLIGETLFMGLAERMWRG